RYLNTNMPDGMPGLAAAFFLLGILVYSALVRAEYPDIGSNWFRLIDREVTVKYDEKNLPTA
ncbi:DUF1422 family protein, partial [Pantoea agglomerans]|uniref:DUF1422 family protein n=1 Tax=Enterobacter agglomerans TaxID=549 RepID=UPI001A8DF72E